MRKRSLTDDNLPASGGDGRASAKLHEIDLQAHATIQFSSEDASHPIENMFDGSSGMGAKRWISAREDVTEELLIEFDAPQRVSQIDFDVEEGQVERTQQIRTQWSSDGGNTFRQAFVQEYNFSPQGSTYESEHMRVDLRGVTHLRVQVMPNKSGSGRATVTSLRLFS